MLDRLGGAELGAGSARRRRAVAGRRVPAPATMSRRALLGDGGRGIAAAAPPGRRPVARRALPVLALLLPRGRSASGPARLSGQPTRSWRLGYHAGEVGSSWRLSLVGERTVSFRASSCWPCRSTPMSCRSRASRDGRRPSAGAACGCATSRRCAGQGPATVTTSRFDHGTYGQASLGHEQVADERSLLALWVNGVDLSLDHGFPARVISPAVPGVHCTKWVSSMTFAAVADEPARSVPARYVGGPAASPGTAGELRDRRRGRGRLVRAPARRRIRARSGSWPRSFCTICALPLYTWLDRLLLVRWHNRLRRVHSRALPA